MENLIEIDSKVMVGKPVIKGTRITVEFILAKLSGGETIDQILHSYPHLNRDQILACLDYARRSLSLDYIYPFAVETA